MPEKFGRRMIRRALSAILEVAPSQRCQMAIRWQARRGRFRQLFRQYFDVEACARSALGPHWQKATAQQRQEFVGLYEDYIVIVYSTSFGPLGSESFQVLGSQSDKEGVIVTSRIDRSTGCIGQRRLATQPDQS